MSGNDQKTRPLSHTVIESKKGQEIDEHWRTNIMSPKMFSPPMSIRVRQCPSESDNVRPSPPISVRVRQSPSEFANVRQYPLMSPKTRLLSHRIQK